jgi:hypothetical protein
MPGYAMLLLLSANRVYASASLDLARAELTVFTESVLGGDETGTLAPVRTQQECDRGDDRRDW